MLCTIQVCKHLVASKQGSAVSPAITRRVYVEVSTHFFNISLQTLPYKHYHTCRLSLGKSTKPYPSLFLKTGATLQEKYVPFICMLIAIVTKRYTKSSPKLSRVLPGLLPDHPHLIRYIIKSSSAVRS